jgi:hypothetical protein
MTTLSSTLAPCKTTKITTHCIFSNDELSYKTIKELGRRFERLLPV